MHALFGWKNTKTPHLYPELPAQVAAGGDDKGLSERATARHEETGGALFTQNFGRAILSPLLGREFLQGFGARHQHLGSDESGEVMSRFCVTLLKAVGFV